jgi:hypothetical protein
VSTFCHPVSAAFIDVNHARETGWETDHPRLGGDRKDEALPGVGAGRGGGGITMMRNSKKKL